MSYRSKVVIDPDADFSIYTWEETMKVDKDEEAGQVGVDHAARLDRALTLGGHTPTGKYKESTAKLYAAAWSAFESWCTHTGRTAMPATPETVAMHAVSLLRDGYVPDTIKSRIVAIRARHRIMGHPVPDSVPAWAVLRDRESNHVRAEVNGLTRIELHAAVQGCPDTTIGIRNRALALLLWDVLLPVPDVIALDMEDVTDPCGDSALTILGRTIHHDHGGLMVACPHCHAEPGQVCRWISGIADPHISHVSRERAASDRVACPACALRAWIRQLRLAGIRTGALFRPVDRLGTIAGSGVRRSGCSSPDHRLSVRSVHRTWKRIIADAGLDECTPRSLRLGGAKARVESGEPIRAVITRAGWSPTTASVVGRLAL